MHQYYLVFVYQPLLKLYYLAIYYLTINNMPINSSGSYDSNKFRLAHMIYEILPCNSWEKTACCSCLKGKYKENKRDNRKKKTPEEEEDT